MKGTKGINCETFLSLNSSLAIDIQIRASIDAKNKAKKALIEPKQTDISAKTVISPPRAILVLSNASASEDISFEEEKNK